MSQRRNETDVEYQKRKEKNKNIVFNGLMKSLKRIHQAAETGKKLKTIKYQPGKPKI